MDAEVCAGKGVQTTIESAVCGRRSFSDNRDWRVDGLTAFSLSVILRGEISGSRSVFGRLGIMI